MEPGRCCTSPLGWQESEFGVDGDRLGVHINGGLGKGWHLNELA